MSHMFHIPHEDSNAYNVDILFHFCLIQLHSYFLILIIGIYGAYTIPVLQNSLPLYPNKEGHAGLETETTVSHKAFGATKNPKMDFSKFLLLKDVISFSNFIKMAEMTGVEPA